MGNMTTAVISTAFFAIETDQSDYVQLAVSEEGELKQGLILARNSETGQVGVYSKEGENGLNVPRFILYSDYDVDAAAVTAGSISVAVMVAGKVRQDMIFTAAGDEISNVETDGLNTNNIICAPVKSLNSTNI